MPDIVWTGGTSTAFATAANWLPAQVPADGDNIIFDGRAQNDLAGSDQSAIEIATMRISSDFVKLIGTYSAGVITHLSIGPVTTIIGEPRADGTFGSGSAMIALNYTADANTTRVLSTATTGTGGFPPVLLKGTHSARSLQVYSGWVGDGVYLLNESSAILILSVLGSDALVETGGGVTLATVHQTSGNLFFRTAVTTLNQEGGSAQSEGSGAITTAEIGGTFVSNSTGTITTCRVQNGGALELRRSNTARTISNLFVYGTGIVEGPTPASAVTLTNGADLQYGARSEQIRGFADITISFSAL